jgi:hypothetical protein
MHPNDYRGEWNNPRNIGPMRVDFSKMPPHNPAALCICRHRRDDHDGSTGIGNTRPCDCTRFRYDTTATPAHPALAVDPDGGTRLEREAARVIRTAVGDFEREAMSLSAVEHLLRRLGNLADILDRSDLPTATPEHCRRCGIVITTTGHPRYCAVCDDVLNGGHRVMS